MATMPKSATEAFDTLIPEALSKFPDKARELNAIYGFKISGEGGGEWLCDLTANPPFCKRQDPSTAQCTIEMTHEDFMVMLGDLNQAMNLYFSGKLKVSGDPMLAMKLQPFLDLAKSA